MLRLGLNRRSGAWAGRSTIWSRRSSATAERTLARVTPGVREKGAARALHLAAQALPDVQSSICAARRRRRRRPPRHGERRREDRRRRRRRRDRETRVRIRRLARRKALADSLRTRRHYFSRRRRAPSRDNARAIRACWCLSTRSPSFFASDRWLWFAISSRRREAAARSARRC